MPRLEQSDRFVVRTGHAFAHTLLLKIPLLDYVELMLSLPLRREHFVRGLDKRTDYARCHATAAAAALQRSAQYAGAPP